MSLFTRAAPEEIAVEAPHKNTIRPAIFQPFIVALQERPQRHLHICVCHCISHNGEGTEASCTLMEMWRKQMWKADMSELWSARKKNEVMSFTRMERHQVKQSKPDSDRYYILFLRI